MLKKLAFCALLSCGAGAQAAPVFFTDASAFAAAAGPLAGSEDFEVAQRGATHAYAGFTFSEIGGTTNNAVNHNAITLGGWNPVQTGSGAVWFDDNGSSVARFEFLLPINALGVYVTTRPEFPATSNTVAFTAGSAGSSFTTTNAPSFFGVILDSPETVFDFAANNGPEIGFDTARFGTASIAPVPLPATAWLLAVALGGLAVGRRTRG